MKHSSWGQLQSWSPIDITERGKVLHKYAWHSTPETHLYGTVAVPIRIVVPNSYWTESKILGIGMIQTEVCWTAFMHTKFYILDGENKACHFQNRYNLRSFEEYFVHTNPKHTCSSNSAVHKSNNGKLCCTSIPCFQFVAGQLNTSSMILGFLFNSMSWNPSLPNIFKCENLKGLFWSLISPSN